MDGGSIKCNGQWGGAGNGDGGTWSARRKRLTGAGFGAGTVGKWNSKKPFTGMQNMSSGLSNICYQNSLLQAMRLSEGFAADVMCMPGEGTVKEQLPLPKEGDPGVGKNTVERAKDRNRELLQAENVVSALSKLFTDLSLSGAPKVESRGLQVRC